jgi:hypothetical protein
MMERKDLQHYIEARARGEQMVKAAQIVLEEARQQRQWAEKAELLAATALARAKGWLRTQEEMILFAAAEAQGLAPIRKDVHTEHCCSEHKQCKYFDEANCSVCQGWAKASYPCNCNY